MASCVKFFSHDTNSSSDPKIKAIKFDYQMAGIGLFWTIIEMLCNEDNYKMKKSILTYKGLQGDVDFDVEKFINDCITYELFVCDDEYFWSKSLLNRMELMESAQTKRSEKARANANKKWAKIKGNTVEDEKNAIVCDIENHSTIIALENNATEVNAVSNNNATSIVVALNSISNSNDTATNGIACDVLENAKEKKRKEKKIKEKVIKDIKDNTLVILANDEQDIKKNKFDFQKYENFWNKETCLPKINGLTDRRKRAIKTLDNVYGFEKFCQAVVMANESDYLSGRKVKWKATFDWLVNINNIIKIIEGNYSNTYTALVVANSNKKPNFEQRTWDFDKIEKLARERM